MRKHLTILLLFVSICFYGQEVVGLEGFYKQNGGEHLFFPLVDKEVMYPLHLDLKQNKLPTDFNNTALIKLKGKKIKQSVIFESYFLDYKIEADEVTVVNNNLLLEDYLKNYQVYKTELKEGEQRLEYFEETGFYTGQFEEHEFVWFDNEEYQGDSWPFFDEKLKNNILINGERGLGLKSSLNRGIYLKVKGIRSYGGYFGRRSSQINVSAVMDLDITKTLWEFIERKIKENGFYEYGTEKLTFPKILDEDKTYTFIATTVCDCILEAKRTGGYIDYTFTEKEDNRVKSRFNGRLIANPWTYNKEPFDAEMYWDNYQITYESLETKSRVYDNSKFTVQVYKEKDENGNIVIAIEDYINNREFGLTEMKTY